MAKAILTTKIDPTYDDLPKQRYHFPRTYLRQVEAAIGDWIVYYEPRRPSGDLMTSGGRQSYFATERLESIIPDPSRPDHFYALVDDFLPFDHAGPFKEGNHYYEAGLRKVDGSTTKGVFGRAVRNVSDTEYDLIITAGFAHALGMKDRPSPDPAELPGVGFADNPQMPHEADTTERRIVSQIVQRPFRDRAFSSVIKTAYHDTCAVTGLSSSSTVVDGPRCRPRISVLLPMAGRIAFETVSRFLAPSPRSYSSTWLLRERGQSCRGNPGGVKFSADDQTAFLSLAQNANICGLADDLLQLFLKV